MIMQGPARCLLALTAMMTATPLCAAMQTIAPHRAIYDLALESAEGQMRNADIEGRLVLETTGTVCEGFTVNTRFVTRIVGERASLVNDLRSATWEAGDGSSYRFVTRNFVNDNLADETDGSAAREDGAIAVDLKAPEETEFELDPAVLFPTQHVRRVLGAAQDGETIVAADVYDGSDTGRKVYATTTVIGSRRAPGESEGDVGRDVLGKLDSWPVTVGYFDSESDTPDVPAYEFSYDLFANGVSRDIVLDYGDFTLAGDLTSIEFHEPAPCDP